MSWKIILEDENKKNIASLSEEFYFDYNNIPFNFKLLGYLDPFGDTVFNRVQMDDLITDLILLNNITSNNSLITKIQILAEQCKKLEHSYLVFYGD